MNPILVSVGELRQKMIELHTLKTKKGNVDVEITMNKKFDLDLHALMLSTGHIDHRMKELVENQNKIATKNIQVFFGSNSWKQNSVKYAAYDMPTTKKPY